MHIVAIALLAVGGAVFAGISAVRRDAARGATGTRRRHGRRNFGVRSPGDR